MPPQTPSPLMRFGLVLLSVGVALLLRWPLWPIMGVSMPLLFFWPAVIVCAGVGGLWPGLLATVLSALGGGIFFWSVQDPVDVMAPGIWIGLLLFVALGGLTSLGLERLQEVRRELRDQGRTLAAERDWLRAFLTAMAQGVIVTDDVERVTFLNPAAGALTGWRPEQALGKHANEIFHIISEKTRQTIEKPIARVLREGKAAGLAAAALLVARDGTEKHIEQWIAPVRDAAGNLLGAVINFDEPSHRRAPVPGPIPGSTKAFEPAALSEVPTEAPPVSVRLRILIVEDNRESAEGLAMLLTLQGHEVAIAYSGSEAIARAAEWHPQMVLCDINLPGMDGNSVASALRQNPATARARLIAITGSGSEEDRHRCLLAGFDHHLTKPVDPHILQTVIALQTLVASNEHRG